MTATGFPKGDTWYFAIRTQDRVTNWSALSNVRNILDLGFRPDHYGYPFPNYSDTQPSDLTADDLARMLGHDYVCWNTSWPYPPTYCSPKYWVPSLLTWILKQSEGGHCTGFTATSLRFFRQVGNPPSTYQAGAATAHDLLKPNARRHLMYYWTKQMYKPVLSVRNASYTATAAQNIVKLQSALSGSQLDPLDMHIWHKFANGTVGGHSILPYALEDRGGGVWRVWVYDNNYADSMDKFAVINTVANTWSYAPLGWGGGCGSDGNSMGLVPVSTYAQTPDDAALAAIGAGSPLAPGADTAGIGLAGAGHLADNRPARPQDRLRGHRTRQRNPRRKRRLHPRRTWQPARTDVQRTRRAGVQDRAQGDGDSRRSGDGSAAWVEQCCVGGRHPVDDGLTE